VCFGCSTRAAREVFRAMATEVASPNGGIGVAAQSAPVWFALHAGDVTYGMDAAKPAKRAAMAAGFYISAEPLTSAVPMATAIGNHDMLMFQQPSTVENRASDGIHAAQSELAVLDQSTASVLGCSSVCARARVCVGK
jgi:hypothetical protein